MMFNYILDYLINFILCYFFVKLQIKILNLSFKLYIHSSFDIIEGFNYGYFIKLRSMMLININQAISWFRTVISSKSFLHYNIFWFYRDSMIIETPPWFGFPIEDVSIIVTTFCETLMNHYSMQIVRAILWLKESCL